MTAPTPTPQTPRAGRNALLGVGLVVALLLGGGALVGLSVHLDHHHSAARAAQASARARVDRRAAAEARHPGAEVTGGGGVSRISRRSAARGSPSDPGSSSARGFSSITARGAVLIVPALEVRARIVAEGAADGSMNIPSDIHEVGWYDGLDNGSDALTAATHPAPWPGQAGVAVLAGHVDWAGEGPGALYYLGQLRVGDPIQVVGSNGRSTEWRVSRAPITIAKTALPSDLFDNTGPAKLALVTCGGPFDAATGHYLDNVIVWASQAGPS